MTELLFQLLTEYGVQAASWVFAALAAVGVKYLWGRIKNETAAGIIERAYFAVTRATQEVWQTYVQALKEANADGKLTDVEKRNAKKLALDAAKKYLGKKGIAELIKILGVDPDDWLGGLIESVVGERKLLPPA